MKSYETKLLIKATVCSSQGNQLLTPTMSDHFVHSTEEHPLAALKQVIDDIVNLEGAGIGRSHPLPSEFVIQVETKKP